MNRATRILQGTINTLQYRERKTSERHGRVLKIKEEKEFKVQPTEEPRRWR